MYYAFSWLALPKEKARSEKFSRERANSVTMAEINVQHKSIIRKLFFIKFRTKPAVFVRIEKSHPLEGVTNFVSIKHHNFSLASSRNS